MTPKSFKFEHKRVKFERCFFAAAGVVCNYILQERTPYIMTLQELKTIIANIPDNAVVLLSTEDLYEVETVRVEIHPDGRIHLFLTNEE